ncbi:MAG: transporter, family, sugar efflux transporter [Propionibacteriaceae bacterium]|nr:transporter, family, sugar efflux transporter [Propionibacteriaceae bacterium]
MLIRSAALLWGLQFAFLNPALALVLVELFGATAAEVGLVLAVYNASGFVASLVLPAYADRKRDYLRPMLACGLLTLALALLLTVATSLPMALIGLVLLGGPAGVGSSLLFAHLKHSGAKPADIVHTRAIVSVAWVAGPPLAAFIIGSFGNSAILLAIAAVAALNIATTAVMLAQRARPSAAAVTPAQVGSDLPMSRVNIAVIVAAFIALQATNSTVVSIMSLFVTRALSLDVMWAGVALAVAAGLEIPALLLIGRLSQRFSSLGLIASGCLAGIVYYVAMAFVSGPVVLLGLQVLNAWFFATVAGTGLALFQQIIPRPGLASGLYANTRRLGAIVSGPIISFGSLTPLGYSGIFVVCALLTGFALIMIGVVSRATRRKGLPIVGDICVSEATQTRRQ